MDRRPSWVPIAARSALSPRFRFIPNRRSCLPRTAHRAPSVRSPRPGRRRGVPGRSKFDGGPRPGGPGTPRRPLYRPEPSVDARYPEGNFDVNQLPGGSIGLSPLSARRTNDLHVSTVGGPPPGFPPASPRARIDHRLSGPNARTLARSPPKGSRPAVPPGGFPPRRFRYAPGLRGPRARTSVRLLGPCYETGRTVPSVDASADAGTPSPDVPSRGPRERGPRSVSPRSGGAPRRRFLLPPLPRRVETSRRPPEGPPRPYRRTRERRRADRRGDECARRDRPSGGRRGVRRRPFPVRPGPPRNVPAAAVGTVRFPFDDFERF